MRTSATLLFCFVAAIALTGCKKKDEYYPRGGYYTYEDPIRTFPEDPAKTKDEYPTYVTSYRLYTSESSKGPAGKASPAVVLASKGGGTWGRCTGVHWTSGLVMTNAHCVADGAEARNFYFIYWDKSGAVKYTRATKLENRGTPNAVDAAVFRISDAAAATWDAFGGEFNDTASLIGSSLGTATMDASIWAFDHSNGTYSDYSSLVIKNCKATPRTRPEMRGKLKSDGTWISINDTDADEVYHLFYDNCNVGPKGGNSGSLITDSSGKALGLHWGSFQNSQLRERYSEIELKGADGVVRTNSTASDGFISGVGAAMDYALTLFHMR